MHLSQVSKPNKFGSKDIAQDQVFQNTRSKFKIKVTRSKVFVLKERSIHNASIALVKINVSRSKVLVQNEGSLHEVSICEISASHP
jgi:hypothetical protein